MAQVLGIEALEIGYGGQALLPPCSVSIEAGQMWAILGPNGAGKTTLLRTLLGLHAPLGGALRWAPGARVGYVPQRASLESQIPARVVDIVRDGLSQGWSFLRPGARRGAAAQVARALEDAQISALARRPFGELSEGQKQRVLVARALAADPRALVLDEPTSAMDIGAERVILELLDRLRVAREMAVLIVSHHLHAVGHYATHALLVDKDHQALVSGPLEVVARDRACVSLYGAVLMDAVAHNHNCCDHDHVLPEEG
jgi:zinc transport system ATP-binding protein